MSRLGILEQTLPGLLAPLGDGRGCQLFASFSVSVNGVQGADVN